METSTAVIIGFGSYLFAFILFILYTYVRFKLKEIKREANSKFDNKNLKDQFFQDRIDWEIKYIKSRLDKENK